MITRIVQQVEGYDSRRMQDDISQLVDAYDCLHAHVFGHSVLGRELVAVEIANVVNEESAENHKKIHWNGAFHANEWITAPLLMRGIEQIAQAWQAGASLGGRDVRRLLTKQSVWVVPMVNPDGVDLVLHGADGVFRQDQKKIGTPVGNRGVKDHKVHEGRSQYPYIEELIHWNGGSSDFSGWKANIRGVDLNDQFPAYWQEEVNRRQVEEQASRDFPGHRPLCEPEALAMAMLAKQHNFDMVMCFHTQGREIYWNYRGMEPSNAREIAEFLASRCGYRAVSITDSDAGFKDWFIQEFRRPGFTVEVGEGINPLPLAEFDSYFAQVSELLLASLAVTSGLSDG